MITSARRAGRDSMPIHAPWLAVALSVAMQAPQEPIVLGPPPPPATTLEAFRALPGTILTTAYEELGEVSGVLVEAREMRDSLGARVRGGVVTLAASGPRQAPPDQAFVDPDELPALLRAFDAL